MAHNDLNSWRKVGEKFGITGAMAFRIAKRDYEPKTPQIRVQLDLPAMVDVPACPDCGRGHAVGWCTARYGEPTKPRNKKPRRPPWYKLDGVLPDDGRMSKVYNGWTMEE